MMTYEQYQQAIVDNQEAMKETRRLQNEERRKIEDRRSSMIDEAKCKCRAEIGKIHLECDELQKESADKFRDRRTALYMKHCKIVSDYKAQTGITPPYVEYSKEGGES